MAAHEGVRRIQDKVRALVMELPTDVDEDLSVILRCTGRAKKNWHVMVSPVPYPELEEVVRGQSAEAIRTGEAIAGDIRTGRLAGSLPQEERDRLADDLKSRWQSAVHNAFNNVKRGLVGVIAVRERQAVTRFADAAEALSDAGDGPMVAVTKLEPVT